MKTSIENKIGQYKRKFYINLIIKGSLLLFSILLFVFLFYVLLESQAQFSSGVRGFLFFSYVALAAVLIYHFFARHFFKLIYKKGQISDDKAASNIGTFFPEIKDKLLNIIQLKRNVSEENQLLFAGINQKTNEVVQYDYSQAIDLRDNFRYLKILAVPLILVFLVTIIFPNVVSEPTERIIHYKREYTPQAPFNVNIANDQLRAFKNEDYQLNVNVAGSSIPEDLFILIGERKLKLKSSDQGSFSHLFVKPQHDIEFKLEAAGFTFGPYKIETVSRPNIKNFDVELNYPSYLNKKLERYNNVGNFQIPEGTHVKWTFETIATKNMQLMFNKLDSTVAPEEIDDQKYEFQNQVINSTDYSINLKNQYSGNKDKIQYRIDVIKDEYPSINFQQYLDTVLYNKVILGGNISDDYGLRNLKVHFKKSNNPSRTRKSNFSTFSIPINTNKNHQSFYYQWMLDSLKLENGDEIDYYLSVSDNDGINGSKTSKTGIYTLKVPTKEKIEETLEKSSQSTENQMDKSLKQAQELKRELENAENKLKGKRDLSWQDEKMLEGIIKQKEELEKEIKELKDKYDNLNKQNNQFNKQQNESIKEKAQELEKLMDEILDEETKKLYEELRKLLEENKNINEVKDALQKLNDKESNLEKELERTLELFKRLKHQQQLEELSEKFDELSEEQQKLSEESESQKAKENSEELLNKQENIEKEMDELQKEIEQTNKLNQELKHPNNAIDSEQEMQDIKQSINESKENLQKGKNKKASESQNNAAQKMKKMSQKLNEMMSSMNTMTMQNNLGDLRYILENLTKLSEKQSNMMNDFRRISQTDPKYKELSQKQLHLQDYAKVIEDSLISLSNKAFQIRSFVTREVDKMNKSLENSIENLRDRKKDRAVGHQQHAMTSMNNLALMLDDVMTQMQQALADMMGNPNGDPQQKNQGISMSQLQEQLNNKIKELKQSGMQGRKMSEELAKLAAEQERLRRMLNEAKEKLNPMEEGSGEKAMEEIIKKMKETEMDLVNKNITRETIKRQEEIKTRLLEHEKSMREREASKDREAEHAKDTERKVPEIFEDYIKDKEQEIELLKTVPPKLNPYYKQEVNKYFKRLGNF